MTGIILSIIIVCIIMLIFSRPRRRDGLVPQGGMRIKNALAVAMVKSGKKRRPDWHSVHLADRRVDVPEGVDQIDYNDSFVFQGADSQGNIILTRLGIRGGGREAEVWFWGSLGGKRYANDTRNVELNPENDDGRIAAAGLEYKRVAEGEWHISYRGTLNGEDSQVDLHWKADAKIYCSADSMDSRSTGLAMAEMPWSRSYFERIRSEKQIRIEQGGILAGTVKSAGETIAVRMTGIRDHSWGKRNWTFLNRYMWTVIALEEPTLLAGITAKYLVVSPADYGDSFKRIVTGWIAGDDAVKPISYANDLMETGDDGVIPGNFTLRFKTPDSDLLVLEAERRQPEMPWVVNNGQFEINEAWCGVRVNGAKGYGVSEFGFAADRGYHRPFERDDGD